jgi:hypothetical protein
MRTYFNAEIWCRLSDKPKGCADMDFDDNVEGIVRCCVQHFVECKASCITRINFILEQNIERQRLTIVDNVIDFPISSRNVKRQMSYDNENLVDKLDSGIHYFLGKIVCGDIALDTDCVASCCLDFANHLVESLLVNTGIK